VTRRVALFLAWALIGAVGSYGLLYLFSPLGLAIVAACAAAGWALPAAGGHRLPEALGLAAGPGLFCLVVAYSAADPVGWVAAGAAIIGAATAVYLRAGRALCAST
jgi:hypothetical protein